MVMIGADIPNLALDNLPVEKCELFKNGIYAFALENYPDMIEKLETGAKVNDGERKRLDECVILFFKENEQAGG